MAHIRCHLQRKHHNTHILESITTTTEHWREDRYNKSCCSMLGTIIFTYSFGLEPENQIVQVVEKYLEVIENFIVCSLLRLHQYTLYCDSQKRISPLLRWREQDLRQSIFFVNKN